MKATALVLQMELAPVLSPRCFHLAGHGGLKGAVRAVDAARRDQTFVFRTDVQSYYDSLDDGILYRQVCEHVTDRRVLKLVWSYLRRMVCEGGDYVAVSRGISLGCPLSPLMGALYLKPLDDLMERQILPYVRYMDDWVILAKTRWALRRVVQQMNTILDCSRCGGKWGCRQGLRITIPGLTHHNSESGLYGKFRIPNKLKLLPYSLATFR